MEEWEDIRWSELVRELCSRMSMANLSHRIGVQAKEIKRWKNGEAKPQARNAAALIEECKILQINWRKFTGLLTTYDFRSRYEINVVEGPRGLDLKNESYIPRQPTSLFGFPLNSRIGIPSSILTINSFWIEPYTNLGFDVFTAKTVRSVEKKVHPLPNIYYVPEIRDSLRVGSMPLTVRATPECPSTDITKISLANSFGMPSTSPQEWQADLQRTKAILKAGQILIASVVGTADKKGSEPKDLIDDYVKCARLAYEIKPHAIELNFSCPNAYGQEGAVYQDPELAGKICQKVKKGLRFSGNCRINPNIL